MTIDIKELRKRLFYRVDLTLEVQTIEELLDRLEAAEQTVQDYMRIDKEKAQLAQRLEAAEKERDNANSAAACVAIQALELEAKLEAKLEAAEKDIAMKEEVIYSLTAVVKRLDAQCDAAEKERDDLRAKIERMEKIESAAQNLVKMKGRHNTEIAYKRLVATLEEDK